MIIIQYDNVKPEHKHDEKTLKRHIPVNISQSKLRILNCVHYAPRFLDFIFLYYPDHNFIAAFVRNTQAAPQNIQLIHSNSYGRRSRKMLKHSVSRSKPHIRIESYTIIQWRLPLHTMCPPKHNLQPEAVPSWRRPHIPIPMVYTWQQETDRSDRLIHTTLYCPVTKSITQQKFMWNLFFEAT